MDNSMMQGIDQMLKNMGGTTEKKKVRPDKPVVLSPIQKQIVESDASHIIVAAGAGSGKTRVLIERIKYLINNKEVDPSSIVAITFTNMAADEMRERLVDVPGVGDAFIGTIHSFANRIFQSSGSDYSIYTDDKDNELHRYLIDRYCKNLTFQKYLAFKDAKVKADMGIIDDSQVNEILLPSEKAELSLLHRSPEAAAKDPQYPETISSLCKLRNIITFDELLQKATDYFKSLNATLDYVLVDELQDVGTLEYRFIQSLNASNYFFVGDDWQAIYGFKGGNVSIFMSLMRDKNYEKFYLTENYRSGSEILKKAESIIEQVPDRIPKKVKPMSKITGRVRVGSRFKVEEYLSEIKNSGDYGNWFILVRTNKEIYQMSEKLQNMGIPYSTFKRSDMTLSDLRAEMDLNTIKVLTVHTSKGLEIPNVMLVGNFPMKEPSYRKNPEERKIMYVGMTRAEEQLIILN